jgi:hypothetical protein
MIKPTPVQKVKDVVSFTIQISINMETGVKVDAATELCREVGQDLANRLLLLSMGGGAFAGLTVNDFGTQKNPVHIVILDTSANG